MRIPDSTWYEEGQPRIEDIPGYTLCTQCRNCPLTHLDQIEDDGWWYCRWKKRWKKGYDLLQHSCPGFRMKTCRRCNRMHCPYQQGVSKTDGWCNNYLDSRYPTPGRFYVGRPKSSLGRLRDPVTIGNEERYAAKRLDLLKGRNGKSKDFLCTTEGNGSGSADNQADGSSEERESEEDEGRDTGV